MAHPTADHQPKIRFLGHFRSHTKSPIQLKFLTLRNHSHLQCSENSVTLPDYTGLILTVTENPSLVAAKSAHAAVVKSGVQSDVFLSNHLLNLYSKCGSTCDTQQVFDEIHQPNTVSWNILISHYASLGLHHQANAIFYDMTTSGLHPDPFTFSALLRVCKDLLDMKQGATLHAYTIKLNHEQKVSVATALVSMYAGFGEDNSAGLLFQSLEGPSLATFNSMISGFEKNGNFLGALNLLVQMKQLGIYPDQVTFLISLNAATGNGLLSIGKTIHAYIIKLGFESDIAISSALVGMYASHGEVELAYDIFIKQQPSDNLLLWTATIAAFSQSGKVAMAIDLFRKMQAAGIEPDQVVYRSVIRACAGICLLKQGKEVHAQLIRAGFVSSTSMGNLLIMLYRKCDRVKDGFNVFNQMADRNPHSWSQIILMCLQQHYHKMALKLMVQMINEGIEVEELTIISIIQVFTDLPEVQSGRQFHASSSSSPCPIHLGRQFHGYLLKLGFHLNVRVSTALVSFYSRHGVVDAAHTIFEQIQEPDTILWTALISACYENGRQESALEIFKLMVSSGIIPDAFTLSSVISSCSSIKDSRQGMAVQAYSIRRMINPDLLFGNTLISLYLECGLVQLAARVFHQMPEHDVASWATIIAGFAQNGQPENSYKFFTQMQRDQVKPDELVISGMINACSSLTSLVSGRQFHALAVQHGFASTIPVYNSLITMYSRSGNIDEAYQIFWEMSVWTTVSWNTMISGLAQNGRSQEALQLFEEMRKMDIRPNATTFLAVLSACSHEGMVHEGQQYFNMMRQKYDLKPSEHHYSCMIDLLSRVGDLDRAVTFITEMPISSCASAWMALLSGCRIHEKMELGKFSAEKLMSMNPDEAGAYVLLANMYAADEQWESVRLVRERMGSRKVKKEPGCSWIEINKKIHIFTVHDVSHRQTDEIYEVLEQLHVQMKIIC